MKLLKRIFGALIILMLLGAGIGYTYLKKQTPVYSGDLKIAGLEATTEVLFDDFGVPHIYAHSGEDAYLALGYLHAQERLFQMELIKRLISGRLAEILGPDLIETDTYYRTLGMRKEAERLANEQLANASPQMKKEFMAYLKGINNFIQEGTTPVEFKLLGMDKEAYTSTDAFCTLVYMAMGFANGYESDIILQQIHQKFGPEYLKDWYCNYENFVPYSHSDSLQIGEIITPILGKSTIPIWTGSNAWTISPEKSKSGRALFANDTHIGFSQPSVWYEAYLEYPGRKFYGDYLAGVPFAPIGHNEDISWGMTIFPVDITDIYKEKINPENPNQYWFVDHWKDMEVYAETIRVKGEDDINIEVKRTHHGPIINEVFDNMENQAASFWWTLYHLPANSFTCFYNMGHASNIDEARSAAATNDILGLNIMYADKEDNIAWWASCKIPKRPEHVNAALFLDGASGKDELLGYYDFSENPQEENPERGYIVSANNEPVFDSTRFAGYYLPQNRYERLSKLIAAKDNWDVESMKSLQADITSDRYAIVSNYLAQVLSQNKALSSYAEHIELLKNWKGEYNKNSAAAVLYTKLQYWISFMALSDELGDDAFNDIIEDYTYLKSYPLLVQNENSPYWDNITTDQKENQKQILEEAFIKSIKELNEQFGKDTKKWNWGTIHRLTHHHAIGKKKPFDKIFNVGDFEMPGGDDSPNKLKYKPSPDGVYPITGGAALRILMDFADIEHSLNILPTGQSGNFMSPHYDDQAAMFAHNEYHVQIMRRDELEKTGKTLILRPK